MRHVLQAPHRLMFFIGAGNVFLAMAWWAAWLVSARWPEVLRMAQPTQYAGWLHAIVMQYQVLASFVFGFLLTVFPRWMGLPDLPRARYVPVGIGVFGGQIATLCGAEPDAVLALRRSVDRFLANRPPAEAPVTEPAAARQ